MTSDWKIDQNGSRRRRDLPVQKRLIVGPIVKNVVW